MKSAFGSAFAELRKVRTRLPYVLLPALFPLVLIWTFLKPSLKGKAKDKLPGFVCSQFHRGRLDAL